MLSDLAPRELEVLSLMSKGYSNQTISKRLVVKTRSVENYVNQILSKLDLVNQGDVYHSRIMAVLIYLRTYPEPFQDREAILASSLQSALDIYFKEE